MLVTSDQGDFAVYRTFLVDLILLTFIYICCGLKLLMLHVLLLNSIE